MRKRRVTDKRSKNAVKQAFGVMQELIIRYGRYEEYTEPFNGEIYWKAFSNDLVWKT